MVVGAATDLGEAKANSQPSYKAITQEIAYLMSAVANLAKPGQTKTSECLGFKSNGNSKNCSNMFQRPKCDRKNMTYWGCEGSGHS